MSVSPRLGFVAAALGAGLILLAPDRAWSQPSSPLVEVRALKGQVGQEGSTREVQGWCVHVDGMIRGARKRLARCALRDEATLHLVQLSGESLELEWKESTPEGDPTAVAKRDRFLALIENETGLAARPSLRKALADEQLQTASSEQLRQLTTDPQASEPIETLTCSGKPCPSTDTAIDFLTAFLTSPRSVETVTKPTEQLPLQERTSPDGSGVVKTADGGTATAAPPITQPVAPKPSRIEPQPQPPTPLPQPLPDSWPPLWLLLVLIVLLLAAIGVGVWTLLVVRRLSRRRSAPAAAPLPAAEVRPTAVDQVAVVQQADRLVCIWLGQDAIGSEQLRQQLESAGQQLGDLCTLAKSFPQQKDLPPANLIELLRDLPIHLQAGLRSLGLTEASDLQSLARDTVHQIDALRGKVAAVEERLRGCQQADRTVKAELARYQRLLSDLSDGEWKRALDHPDLGLGSLLLARALQQALHQLAEAYKALTMEGRADVIEVLKLESSLRSLASWADRVARQNPADVLTTTNSGDGWQLVNNVLRAALLTSVYLPDRGAMHLLRQGLDMAASAIRQELVLAGVHLGHGRLLAAPEPEDRPDVAGSSPLMRLPEARAVIRRLLPLADAKDLVIDYRAFAREGGSVGRQAEPLTLVPAEWARAGE